MAFAVRDALRSGDLYLAESRHHVSFWNLIYNADQWKEKRTRAYDDLKLSNAVDTALDPLRTEFDQAARAFVDGLETNPFAKLRDNTLELSRRDAIAEPDAVQELRRVIETHLPRIRIEDLLIGGPTAYCKLPRRCGWHPDMAPRPVRAAAAAVRWPQHGEDLELGDRAGCG